MQFKVKISLLLFPILTPLWLLLGTLAPAYGEYKHLFHLSPLKLEIDCENFFISEPFLSWLKEKKTFKSLTWNYHNLQDLLKKIIQDPFREETFWWFTDRMFGEEFNHQKYIDPPLFKPMFRSHLGIYLTDISKEEPIFTGDSLGFSLFENSLAKGGLDFTIGHPNHCSSGVLFFSHFNNYLKEKNSKNINSPSSNLTLKNKLNSPLYWNLNPMERDSTFLTWKLSKTEVLSNKRVYLLHDFQGMILQLTQKLGKFYPLGSIPPLDHPLVYFPTRGKPDFSLFREEIADFLAEKLEEYKNLPDSLLSPLRLKRPQVYLEKKSTLEPFIGANPVLFFQKLKILWGELRGYLTKKGLSLYLVDFSRPFSLKIPQLRDNLNWGLKVNELLLNSLQNKNSSQILGKLESVIFLPFKGDLPLSKPLIIKNSEGIKALNHFFQSHSSLPVVREFSPRESGVRKKILLGPEFNSVEYPVNYRDFQKTDFSLLLANLEKTGDIAPLTTRLTLFTYPFQIERVFKGLHFSQSFPDAEIYLWVLGTPPMDGDKKSRDLLKNWTDFPKNSFKDPIHENYWLCRINKRVIHLYWGEPHPAIEKDFFIWEQ